MRISIGLPGTIPGVRGALILDWARRADAGPFASVGTLDRVVYDNFEPLATLAAAGAVTQRVRLMTTVLLAPTRNTGILAKQAASIDALSGGRLTLGLGIGGREEDFLAAPEAFRNRGQRFEEQLATMHRIWSGEPLGPDIGRIGPSPAQPGGPEVLIGGYSPQAVQRVARWGTGFIAGGTDPANAQRLYQAAEEAWKGAGRPGKPRFVTSLYFALGPNAAEGVAAYIHGYYGTGPRAEQIVQRSPTSPEAMKSAMRAFADIGADELMCWPSVASLEQVDRLAEVANQAAP
jgi:alkanesulfonate monooxygenase SsuD/methylene tetrahydromethanopterin reductase-like flavin-dependent oxidoreductase (luciferase family)